MGANCTRWLERSAAERAACVAWAAGAASGAALSVGTGVAASAEGCAAGAAEFKAVSVLQPARATAATSAAIAVNERFTVS
jgi:hypothetical protein